MFRLLLLSFALAGLIVGCKKKTPPTDPAAPTQPGSPNVPTPGTSTAASSLLKQLAKTKREAQLNTADKLADLAETDPAVIPGLIELLQDKTNLGEGQVMAHQPNSVREAAVIALIYCGEPGEKAAVEQGLPILLGGLTDATAAVREHTLIAISRLKTKGASAIPKVWPLTADASAFVRDAAYHCLRELGDRSGDRAAAMLIHSDAGVRTTAAEQLTSFQPLPIAALAALKKALGDESKSIRLAAAEGLVGFGPKAAPAAPNLCQAVRKAVKEAVPNQPFEFEMAVLNALVAIGGDATESTAALLKEKDPLVVYQAVYVLGEIGPPAKSAADAVKALIDIQTLPGEVRLEACRAHAAITGDAKDAAPLVKLALENKEPGVRSAGLQAAARMGIAGRSFADAALPLLADEEPAIRKQAIAYVTTLDDAKKKAAVPALVKLLADELASVRTAAVIALAEFGPFAASAADDLAKSATTDTDDEVRQIALQALSDLGPIGIGAKASVQAILDNPKASDDVKKTALRVLVGMAPGDPATAATVLKLLDSRNVALRDAATGISGQLKPTPANIAAKLAALAAGDANQIVKMHAFRALAEIEPKPAGVDQLLSDSSKAKQIEIAFWAKLAQARMQNRPDDIAKLVRAALAGRFAEQLVAMEALGRHTPAVEGDFPAVDKLTRARDGATRQLAAEALGRFIAAPKNAMPRLIEMLQDRDEDVRVVVIQCLGRFDKADAAEAKPALQRLLRGEGRTQREAKRTLGKL